MSFASAANAVEELARRLDDPAPALARSAQACAATTRARIRKEDLVGSGELLESVYAEGATFGVRADHAGYVEARRPFMPLEGGELEAELSAEVAAICDAYIAGED